MIERPPHLQAMEEMISRLMGEIIDRHAAALTAQAECTKLRQTIIELELQIARLHDVRARRARRSSA